MSDYANEQLLVEDLVGCLGATDGPWGGVRVLREFDYQRGRTDVVALTDQGDVVAFEAKIARWRTALHQAYRNTCYAHRSYVVLPTGAATQAQRYPDAFGRRGVGICCVHGGQIVVVIESPRSEPVQPWLCRMVQSLVEGDEGHATDGS